jgi:N-acetylglucosaminyl-diphospho-decaprenol L-rhamnosyltransferase
MPTDHAERVGGVGEIEEPTKMARAVRADGPIASVTLLMLTNDQAQLTLQALHSLETQGWPAPLLLLDNGSGADTAAVSEDFAHRLGADLRIFGEGQNLGATAGRNYVSARATSEWLLFVDNDVLFTDEFVPFLSELAQATTDIVLPIIVGRNGRVWAAGGVYRPWLSWSSGGYFGAPVDVARERLDQAADFGATACLAIRRSAFDNVLGFDAGYGLYGAEDIDLCLRARKAGATSIRSAAAPVIHLDLGSGVDPLRRYAALRKTSARLRSQHGLWLTRYPSAWFWYLRRSPRLDGPRRHLRTVRSSP